MRYCTSLSLFVGVVNRGLPNDEVCKLYQRLHAQDFFLHIIRRDGKEEMIPITDDAAIKMCALASGDHWLATNDELPSLSKFKAVNVRPRRHFPHDFNSENTVLYAAGENGDVDVILCNELRGPSVMNAYEFIADAVTDILPHLIGETPKTIRWWLYFCDVGEAKHEHLWRVDGRSPTGFSPSTVPTGLRQLWGRNSTVMQELEYGIRE